MNTVLAHPAWPARRILLWALLWALLLSVAEFFVIAPLHSTPLLSFLIWWLAIWSLPMWCAVGCALLLIARRFEPCNEWLVLAAAGAALALAWALAQAVYAQQMHRWARHWEWFASIMNSTGILQSPASGLAAYNLWVGLFYGGLLVAGFVLMTRHERTRALLREAALARSRTEALLGQTQLQGLQAQVDPQLLLTALDEVQALYRREPERADALLERLVEFLRAAVPGLKQRRSTLRAELQLAQAYAELQALLPTGRRWTVETPQPLPELPFPSLLLLPVLALPARHHAPRLVIKLTDDQVRLMVQGLGRELPPRIVQHTQACLEQLLGHTARLRTDDSPQTQLTIELDIAPEAKELQA